MSQALSIFAARAHRRLGPPRPTAAPVVIESAPAPPPPPTVPDAELLSILEAPPLYTDTIEHAFFAKERALRDAFAALSIDAARALHARLSAPRAGDEVAEAFARLVPERRTRLLAFLGDARRRAAIAASKEARRG